MDADAATARMTSLFDNKTLARIERLRFLASRRFTNRGQGEHLAGKSGRSNEFSDYRDYVPGDDTRFVDWNVFARLNRPYLKLYREEERMHLLLLVDASTSMRTEEKFLRARQFAAAFGVMGLLKNERVSVAVFNADGERPERLAPCGGRAGMGRLFRFLEGLSAGGAATVETGVEGALRHHSGRGAAVILSDFLSFGDPQRAFNRLFSAGLEISAIQILGPSELEPEIDGDLRLVDSETGQTLDITSARDLLEVYHDCRAAHAERIAGLCRSRAGRFLTVDAREPLPDILFNTLRRKGWVE